MPFTDFDATGYQADPSTRGFHDADGQSLARGSRTRPELRPRVAAGRARPELRHQPGRLVPFTAR
jgi:hypothetical protein